MSELQEIINKGEYLAKEVDVSSPSNLQFRVEGLLELVIRLAKELQRITKELQ